MRELTIAVRWQPGALPRRARADRRLIHRFVGELEGAPVNRHHLARIEGAKGLHRLFWIHVDIAHEPPWFVRPDGHECDIERTTPCADHAEVRVIAAIT